VKRLIIAAALLVIVAAVCVVSLGVQVNNTQYLLDELEQVQQAYDDGNIELCRTLSRDFVKTFEEKTKHFPLFMRHADIQKIEETVVPLPVMIAEGDGGHFAAQLAVCRNQLEKLSNVETPLTENIF
jgi:hypothetical protein